MEYLSTTEIAKKWGISVQRVRVLCQEDRVPGVIRVGKCYMVPANARKPADFRKKEGSDGDSDVLAPELEMTQRCYENVPEIFYLIDPINYRIVYMNQSAREAFGEKGEKQICYKYVCGRNSPCNYCCIKKKIDWNMKYFHEKTQKHYYLFGRRIKIDGKELFGVNGFDITSETQLREQAEKEKKQYRKLYDFVPAGLAIYKKNNSIITMIRVNKYLREHTGLEDEKLLHIPVENQMEYIHPDDIENLMDTLNYCFHTKKEQKVLFRIWDCNTKQYRWFHMAVKYGMREEDTEYAFANYVDVTERQKMIEELEEKQKQLEKAGTHAKIYYLEYDVDKKLTIFGRETALAYGLKLAMDDFPKQICRPDVLYPEDYRVYCESFDEILNGNKKEITFNVRVYNQQEEKYVWRRVHFCGAYNQEGNLVRIDSTSQDVNEYLELEQRYLQALVQNTIIAWDYDIDTQKGMLYGTMGNPKSVDDRQVYIKKFIHPDYVDDVKLMESKAMQGVRNLQEDILLWNEKKQGYIWHRAIATGICEPGTKRIQKILCTFRKIAKPKSIES